LRDGPLERVAAVLPDGMVGRVDHSLWWGIRFSLLTDWSRPFSLHESPIRHLVRVDHHDA